MEGSPKLAASLISRSRKSYYALMLKFLLSNSAHMLEIQLVFSYNILSKIDIHVVLAAHSKICLSNNSFLVWRVALCELFGL